MRIALAQIQSGTEPEANLKLVEDYTRRAADAGAGLVLFPEATMCRFGVPLSEIARATGRVVGRRGTPHRGKRRRHRDRRDVRTRRRRPRHQHADRRRAGRRCPLRQDLPLRRVRVHRVPHRRAGPRTRDHKGRRRLRPCHCRADASATTSAFPSSTWSWPAAARSSSPCTPHGARGRASSSSGRCWPAPGRWTPAVSSAPSARPIRVTRSPRLDRPEWAAASWHLRSARSSRAPDADPSLLVTDVDPDAVQSVRDTIAVLRNRAGLRRTS